MTHLTRRQALRGTLGALVAGIAGCSGGGGDGTPASTATPTGTEPDPDWPTFQYDNRNTGFNPAATGPAETPSPEWQTGEFFEAHPIIVDDTIYIGGKGSVQALDRETGETQWTYEVGATVRSAPAYADGTVVFNGWDGSIYAVSADDGSEQWVRTESKVAKGSFDGFEFQPVQETGAVKIADGTVYNGGLVRRRDAFWALDLETGETEFAIDSTPGDDENPWETDNVEFQTAPAIADGTAYIVEQKGWVYAIDLDSGAVAWASDPSDGNGGHSSAVVADGTVYFATFGNNSPDQALYALDASSGELQWSYEIGPPDGVSEVEATPTVAHGAVVIGGQQGVLSAVEPDGTERWTFDTGKSILAAATADSERFYVGTFTNSTLYAIDPETGEEVWSVSQDEADFQDEIDTPPVVHEDTVYVNTERGPLVALR